MLIKLELSRVLVQGNPDFSNPQFFEPADNLNQSSVPSPQSNTVILSSISRITQFVSNQFRFPWRFEKSAFHCNGRLPSSKAWCWFQTQLIIVLIKLELSRVLVYGGLTVLKSVMLMTSLIDMERHESIFSALLQIRTPNLPQFEHVFIRALYSNKHHLRTVPGHE